MVGKDGAGSSGRSRFSYRMFPHSSRTALGNFRPTEKYTRRETSGRLRTRNWQLFLSFRLSSNCITWSDNLMDDSSKSNFPALCSAHTHNLSSTCTHSSSAGHSKDKTIADSTVRDPKRKRNKQTMGGYYDEIEIEDMAWDEEKGVYHYPCPCGDRFEISRSQLANYEDIATCPSCSLIIRVVYDPVSSA